MKRADETHDQIQTARKEIRARIRNVLNTQELGSSPSLGQAISEILENGNHPIHGLFALGRLDITNQDHWKALAFVMVDEIFGDTRRGAPPKRFGPVKNLGLLSFMNRIRRMRVEDGYAADAAECLADLPNFLEVAISNPVTRELAEEYINKSPSTLKKYVHAALTDSAKKLLHHRNDIDPGLAEIAEEALNNFRPDWRKGGSR